MTTITILKRVSVLFLALGIFSCNSGTSNSNETKTDSTKADTTTAIAHAPVAAPSMAAPFDVEEVSSKIKSYAAWRPVFDSDSVNRKAAGLDNIAIGRNMADSNEIIAAFKIDDVAKAKAFSADPKLKASMNKAGVISKPEFAYWHVIRFNPDSHEKQWLEVTHRVKDFNAWLKVYDGEDAAKRPSEGTVDVAVARGIDDSNMVKVVLDITDLAKAKAAISSEAKKKLMMSAGVEGKPDIQFYREP
jgi:hypothetical protein